MFKNKSIAELMASDLPDLSYQKALGFEPSYKEVHYLYSALNEEVFNNVLPHAPIQILQRTSYWGCTESMHANAIPIHESSTCVIKLPKRWFSVHWTILILAHEMCHQYQWDIDGLKRMKKSKEPIITHGPSFFKFRDKLMKHGIPLRRAHSGSVWLDKQNLFNC